MKKYWNFKIYYFHSSDLRFNAFSSAFIRFHEKILKFQSSLFSQFRCGIRRMFKRFHKISWKNIEISKLSLFPVQMWVSMHLRAHTEIFMKKYYNFKIHSITSSDVGFNASSSAFIRFHEKILNFQSSLFSQFRFKIQCISRDFIRYHEKILNFQSSLF